MQTAGETPPFLLSVQASRRGGAGGKDSLIKLFKPVLTVI
jgi:hypothetical protein